MSLDNTVQSKAPLLRFRSVFVSDVHLGTRGCSAEYLLDFLHSVECETLYLVGSAYIFVVVFVDRNFSGRRYLVRSSSRRLVQPAIYCRLGAYARVDGGYPAGLRGSMVRSGIWSGMPCRSLD